MPEPSSSPPGMEGMSMYASLASSPNASPPRGAQHANTTTRAGPNESLPASVMEVDSKQLVRQATCVILQLPRCCQRGLPVCLQQFSSHVGAGWQTVMTAALTMLLAQAWPQQQRE